MITIAESNSPENTKRSMSDLHFRNICYSYLTDDTLAQFHYYYLTMRF